MRMLRIGLLATACGLSLATMAWCQATAGPGGQYGPVLQGNDGEAPYSAPVGPQPVPEAALRQQPEPPASQPPQMLYGNDGEAPFNSPADDSTARPQPAH